MSMQYLLRNGVYLYGDPVEGDVLLSEPGAEIERKKALGQIPTDVFISTVFAAPEGAPSDYTWNRESVIRMLSPAVSVRMPKGGLLHGTRAEVLQMAGWMLTYAVEPNTYPPVFAPLAPEADGTFAGGIISQDEYNRVIPLLDEYGVV